MSLSPELAAILDRRRRRSEHMNKNPAPDPSPSPPYSPPSHQNSPSISNPFDDDSSSKGQTTSAYDGGGGGGSKYLSDRRTSSPRGGGGTTSSTTTPLYQKSTRTTYRSTTNTHISSYNTNKTLSPKSPSSSSPPFFSRTQPPPPPPGLPPPKKKQSYSSRQMLGAQLQMQQKWTGRDDSSSSPAPSAAPPGSPPLQRRSRDDTNDDDPNTGRYSYNNNINIHKTDQQRMGNIRESSQDQQQYQKRQQQQQQQYPPQQRKEPPLEVLITNDTPEDYMDETSPLTAVTMEQQHSVRRERERAIVRERNNSRVTMAAVRGLEEANEEEEEEEEEDEEIQDVVEEANNAFHQRSSSLGRHNRDYGGDNDEEIQEVVEEANNAFHQRSSSLGRHDRDYGGDNDDIVGTFRSRDDDDGFGAIGSGVGDVGDDFDMFATSHVGHQQQQQQQRGDDGGPPPAADWQWQETEDFDDKFNFGHFGEQPAMESDPRAMMAPSSSRGTSGDNDDDDDEGEEEEYSSSEGEGTEESSSEGDDEERDREEEIDPPSDEDSSTFLEESTPPLSQTNMIPMETSVTSRQADFGNLSAIQPPPDDTPPVPSSLSIFPSPTDENMSPTPHSSSPTITTTPLSIHSTPLPPHLTSPLPPLLNPLTLNLIFSHNHSLSEITPSTGTIIHSTPLLTPSLYNKIPGLRGVTPLTSLAVGVHTHTTTRQRRVKVAGIFTLLPSQKTKIAVWQWGYGKADDHPPVSLQSLIDPPVMNNNMTAVCYDASTLTVADGLLFLGGTAEGGSQGCVFLSKPLVRERWMRVLVGGRVCVTLAVRDYLLAVGTNEGVSVWNYEMAVSTNRMVDEGRGLMRIYCRLDVGLEGVEEGILVEGGKEEDHGKDSALLAKSKSAIQCTSLKWLPSSSPLSPLPLLACGFTHGLAIYHVSLPPLSSFHPTTVGGDALSEISTAYSDDISSQNKKSKRDNNNLSKYLKDQQLQRGIRTPPPKPAAPIVLTLSPIAASRASLSALHRHSSQHVKPLHTQLAWLSLGPRAPPAVALLFISGPPSTHSSSRPVVPLARLSVGTLSLPLYGSPTTLKPLPYRELSLTTTLPMNTTSLMAHPTIGLITYALSEVPLLRHSLRPSSYMTSLSYPLASPPSGLDYDGRPTSGASYYLHTQTLLRDHTEWHATKRVDWGHPCQRHFLLTSVEDDEQDGVGGYTPRCLREVTCGETAVDGLTPSRILRGRTVTAVVFDGMVTPRGRRHPVAFTAWDTCAAKSGNEGAFRLRHGRDVCIVEEEGVEVIMGLSVDGKRVFACRVSEMGEGGMKGVGINESVVGQRIFWVNGRLLFVGEKRRDETKDFDNGHDQTTTENDLRCFLMLGRKTRSGSRRRIDERESLLSLLPRSGDPTLHLLHDEIVETVIVLATPAPPSSSTPKEDGYIAIATTCRVLILCPQTLSILSSHATILTSPSLAPLGPAAVAYFSRTDRGSPVRLTYLTLLPPPHATNTIATLPQCIAGQSLTSSSTPLLLSLLPDRFVYVEKQSSMATEEDKHGGRVPLSVTRPAFLLEGMVASHLGMGSGDEVIRRMIDRFGRKGSSFPHRENEGIGLHGTGLTAPLLTMLLRSRRTLATHLLTTGFPPSHTTTIPPEILPQWIPTPLKTLSTFSSSYTNTLCVLSTGDPHGPSHVMDPEKYPGGCNALPVRRGANAAKLARLVALRLLKEGKGREAMRFLDYAGDDRELLDVTLSMMLRQQKGKKDDDETWWENVMTKIISEDGSSGGVSTTTTSRVMAALALELKKKNVVVGDDGEFKGTNENMEMLSDYRQRSRMASARGRGWLIGELSNQEKRAEEEKKEDSKVWMEPLSDANHVWTQGPSNCKDNLLLLSQIDEWLGKHRPPLIGKEGAAIAQESGERTLADILRAAAAATKNDSSSDDDSVEDEGAIRWTPKIGEGRTDEENLVAYFRFSEGGDEDDGWRQDGIVTDLTSHGIKATIGGGTSTLTEGLIHLEATTSRVDEGEIGKVNLLYDVVFDEYSRGTAGVGMVASRGGPLDVGILHPTNEERRENRKRCSVELWYHLPPLDDVDEMDEIILMRRSVLSKEKDVGNAAEILCGPEIEGRDGAIWELAVIVATGRLEFRSGWGGGNQVRLESRPERDNAEGTPGGMENVPVDPYGDDASDSSNNDNDNDEGLVSWQRDDGYGGWNHVCITFSSKNQTSPHSCSINIIMGGKTIREDIISLILPGIPPPYPNDTETESQTIDNLMSRTIYLFGIAPPSGFRMTELRVWSCERKEEDVSMMMCEYLPPAEKKKKFKVKIRNQRRGIGGGAATGRLKALPQTRSKLVGRLAPPSDGMESDAKRERGGGGGGVATLSGKEVHFQPPFEVFDTVVKEDETSTNNIPTMSETIAPAPTPPVAFEMDFTTTTNDEPPKTSNNVTADRQTFEDEFFGSSSAPNTPAGASSMESSFFSKEYETPSPQKQQQEPNPPSLAFGDPFLSQQQQNNNDPISFPSRQPNDDNDGVSSHHSSSDESDPHESERRTTSLNDMMLPSFFLNVGDLLSTEIGTSAAAALIRGPPATRHFGGNRGGMMTGCQFEGDESRGAGSVAICGTDKTVIFAYGRTPPAKTYPIGASGAIVSDVMVVNGEKKRYLCCFIAKEKRLAVFELSRKTIMVELQMTTKLNFWRYLPPNVFLENEPLLILITPIGGFHWKPLDESPRPRQMWKRGVELQGKKIISYEEGGYNAHNQKSMVGLVLASTVKDKAKVEAWYVPIGSDHKPILIRPKVMGAALCRPSHLGLDETSTSSAPPSSSFTPLLCLVTADDEIDDHIVGSSEDSLSGRRQRRRQLTLQIETIICDYQSHLLGEGVVLNEIELFDDEDEENEFEDDHADFVPTEPNMAMGTSPEVFVLCLEDVIVVILRKKGVVLGFLYSDNEIHRIGRKNMDRYVVDAAIHWTRVGGGELDDDNEVEIILLLCDPEYPGDGCVATIRLSHSGMSF